MRYDTAVSRAVQAWLDDDGRAADMVASLPSPARLQALRRIGYSTRAHLEVVDPELLDD